MLLNVSRKYIKVSQEGSMSNYTTPLALTTFIFSSSIMAVAAVSDNSLLKKFTYSSALLRST